MSLNNSLLQAIPSDSQEERQTLPFLRSITQMSHVTVEGKREAARLRQQKSRANRRIIPLPAKPKKSVERTFASFMKVKAVRRDGRQKGIFYIDMVVGPYFFPGQRYVAETGQLQGSSCKTERHRVKLSDPYYVTVVRPMVIAAIEGFLTAEKGKPARLPASMLFPAKPRKARGPYKPRKTKEMAAD
jgi:hypothetical protein